MSISDSGRRLLMLAVGGLYWLHFCARLHVDWTVNPQYSYGWFVPVLAAALLHRRWLDRPEPAPSDSEDAERRGRQVALALAVLAGMLLPLRLVLEANPDWRRPFWVLGSVNVAISLIGLWHVGGRPWVRHFGFPVLFLLISVPWPMGLERILIQGLMRIVTATTVETVGLLGIPALQHGNIIEIANGNVGVDEACSGVRSLQSSIMIGVFLGELYRLDLRWRGFMALAAVGLAFVFNVGRTTLLTWCAATLGLERMHVWHDAAGTAVAVFSMGGMWLVALLIRRWIPQCRRNSTDPPGAASSGLGGMRTFPAKISIGLAIWLGFVEVANEAWYRSHERDLVTAPRWSLRQKPANVEARDAKVSEEALAMLRCSDSRHTLWRDAEGNQWNLFHLRWAAGRNSVSLAKGHRPDVCLPGLGWIMRQDLGMVPVDAGGIRFLFRQYLFEQSGVVAHVFYGLWEEHSGAGGESIPEESTVRNRLSAVLQAKRNRGQQLIEVVITGPVSAPEALALFGRQFAELIQPGNVAPRSSAERSVP